MESLEGVRRKELRLERVPLEQKVSGRVLGRV
jgi:hypothetical protein